MGKNVLIGILLIIALFFFGTVVRGCNKTADTANKMADQTVFNADKHVQSYEDFKHLVENYEMHKLNMKNAERDIKDMKDANVDTNSFEYKNAINGKIGHRNMANKIAAEYNAMSKIWYQEYWKSDGAPEKLELL